jgi:hypothetical protein
MNIEMQDFVLGVMVGGILFLATWCVWLLYQAQRAWPKPGTVNPISAKRRDELLRRRFGLQPRRLLLSRLRLPQLRLRR